MNRVIAKRFSIVFVLASLLAGGNSFADELLFRYEGDVHPSEGGFAFFDRCTEILSCTDFIEDGHYVIEWATFGDNVNYDALIARDPDPPPETLWVEWRYRSNLPLPVGENGCDGAARVVFRQVFDLVDLHGDSVISFDGGTAIFGLPVNTFYTVRFESPDGKHYTYAIDGQKLFLRIENTDPPFSVSSVQFQGAGQCTRVSGPIIRNEWDFVRYGTISDGEAIVASDPPEGVVNAFNFPNLDKFTVTFDQPGFVYVDDVAVEVLPSTMQNCESGMANGNRQSVESFDLLDSAIAIPQVLWVRRPDESGPETVQIVLDQPLPQGMTTRFTFNTGGSPNTVEYTYLLLGACCLANGSCVESEEGDCDSLGGAFVPGGECPGPGACCLADGSCTVLDPACCEIEGDTPSTPLGNGEGCEGDGDFDGVDGACGDECPFDPNKTEPGQCGCDVPDTDSDFDTVADCADQCPGEDDMIDENNDGLPDCRQFQPIPTVTAWGLVILAVVLATGSKVRSVRRPARC